jgi:hypothetical protein
MESTSLCFEIRRLRPFVTLVADSAACALYPDNIPDLANNSTITLTITIPDCIRPRTPLHQ